MIHTRPSRHISKRGAFGALHGLRRVGRHRGIPPEDWDWPPRFGPVLETLLGVRWPEPGTFRSASLGRHDQWRQNAAIILDLVLQVDTFTLTINHYDIERLAAVIVDYQGWRPLQSAFPVVFAITDVSEFHALTAVEDSAILKIRHRIRSLREELESIRCIFEIPSEEGSKSIVFSVNESLPEFRRKGHSPEERDNGTCLCVSGKCLTVRESYREGWAEQFGEDAMFILDRFDPLWPRNDWGVRDFQRWFEEQFSADEKMLIEIIRDEWLTTGKRGQDLRMRP